MRCFFSRYIFTLQHAKLVKHAFIGSIFLFLSACSILPKQVAPELYVLSGGAQQVKPESPTLPLTLKITLPEAAPGLEGARIAVQEAPNKLTYYTGAAWAGPLPNVVQNALVDSITRSGAFRAVASDAEGVRADLALMVHILNSEVDNTGGNSQVHVRLLAKIIDSAGRDALSSVTVDKTIAPDAPTMQSIASAFDRAYGEAAQQIVVKLREAGAVKLQGK